MAQVDTAPAPAPTEKTFTKYTAAQASTYTQLRRNYHASVYDHIISTHTSTGGQLNTVVDVGCGPGLATRTLATSFQNATGLDPSPGMIETALSVGGTTSSGTAIAYAVSSAESLTGLAPNSVDLITAANAAHWFSSMRHFWARAATVLVSGGSVAIWTSGGPRAHPKMPAYEAIQRAMDEELLEGALGPFTEPGSLIVRNKYRDLPLPWDCEPPVPEFEKAEFVHRQWKPEEGEVFHEYPEGTDPDEGVSLNVAEKMLGTGSAVTRWREAHPDLAGTDEDVVRKFLQKMGRLQREAGVELGQERMNGVYEGVVLLVKKRKDA